MKRNVLSSLALIATIAVSTLAVSGLHAAEQSTTRRLSIAERIALDALNRRISDEALAAELANDGVTPGPFLENVKASVRTMRIAVAEGITPESRWFLSRVDELRGTPADAAVAPANVSSRAPSVPRSAPVTPPAIAVAVTDTTPAEEASPAPIRIATRTPSARAALSDEAEAHAPEIDTPASSLPTYPESLALAYATKDPADRGEAEDKALLTTQLTAIGIPEDSPWSAQILDLVRRMRPLLRAKLNPKQEAFWGFLGRPERGSPTVGGYERQQTDGPPGVNGDPEYRRLHERAAALRTHMAAQSAIIATPGTTAAARSEAVGNHDRALDQLTAVIAQQELISARYAVAAAEADAVAAAGTPAEPAKVQALAEARQAESAAHAAHEHFSELLAVSRDVRAQYLKLKADEQAHFATIDASKATEAKVLPEAANPDEKKKHASDVGAAKKARGTAEAELAKNLATQKLLRASHAAALAKQALSTAPQNEILRKDTMEAERRMRIAETSLDALGGLKVVNIPDDKRSPFAFTHGGLRMLSPYSIEPETNPGATPDDPPVPTGRHLLKADKGTKVGGFFEFVYSNVWAWRPVRQRETKWGDGPLFQYMFAGNSPFWRGNPEQKIPWFINNAWDMMARVSFEFGQDDKPSASTITGSGDFNLEFTLEKHLARGLSKDGRMAFSANLGASLAGVTDKSSFKVHPRLLLGPSFAVSFDDPFSGDADPRKVWFRLHGGRAMVDGLNFLEPDHSTAIQYTLGGESPDYSHKYAWAFESELFWPLRENALLSVGARFYGRTRPAPWSLYLGLTLPIAEVADALAPK